MTDLNSYAPTAGVLPAGRPRGSRDPIWNRINFLWFEEAVDFELMRPSPVASDPARPLLVLVHPGDATEDEPSVRRQARELERAMGQEILDIADSHDLVVLHRQSSEYGLRGAANVPEAYLDAVERIHRDGTVLYGDDLETAAAWIIAKLDVASRPNIHLTGAWSHPDHGCVTALGVLLAAANARISLSAHSPSGPGTTEGQWVPTSRAEAFADEDEEGPSP